jgi:hypothetical protein
MRPQILRSAPLKLRKLNLNIIVSGVREEEGRELVNQVMSDNAAVSSERTNVKPEQDDVKNG